MLAGLQKYEDESLVLFSVGLTNLLVLFSGQVLLYLLRVLDDITRPLQYGAGLHWQLVDHSKELIFILRRALKSDLNPADVH